jgi:dipeptidyl aminopeptidase/acylaminoacyl peptidase
MTALLALLLLAADPAASAVPGLAAVPGNPNLLQGGVPEVPAALRERMAQYQNYRSASLADVSADGKAVLVSTRFGSTRQLHLVEQPMGMRQQVTFFDEPVRSGRFQPGDEGTLFFLKDVGGSEFFQVFRMDRRTGRTELLTDGKSRHESLQVSADGRRLAWASNARTGKDTDVYVADAARPREARLLFPAEGTCFPLEFSPDGSRLLVQQFRAATDSDLWLVEVASGERRRLTPAEGKGSVGAAAFAADGKGVWLVTDRWSDFNELYRIDPSRPEARPRSLTSTIPWDVETLEVAPDGSRVALAANVDGISRLYLLEPRTGRLGRVELPAGEVTKFAFPRQRPGTLFVGLMTGRSPPDVWQVDLRTRKLTRWTRSEVGGLDTERFAEPELVRYPSTDGVQVPAFLYRPPASAFPGRRPVVIDWHGGPEGQSRPGFDPELQFWVMELGCAVLLPNVRGSEGYGKAYLGMDDGPKRERSLADIGATLDYIASRADLDPARVAVHGGSYGGYMVLASLAFFPGRVRAGVDIVGISSLPTFLQNTQAYRRDLRRAEYGDERDPAVRAVQERISPLNHVDEIDALLFVQQGKNDPRVPQSEAEQIVQAVRGKGKEVWYLLALNEGHGFGKKENRDHASLATVLFLQKALYPAAVPVPAAAPAAVPAAVPAAGPAAGPVPVQ